MTTTAASPELESRIKGVLASRSLLAHPFYRAWSEGKLPMTAMQEYARQYFHFEAAFPRFLSAIHTRTASPRIRQLILDNLWDEEHGDRNHTALWVEFGKACGLAEDEIRGSTANAETAALVAHFDRVCREAPIGEALATLFAYEGQVPEIAWQKIKGLSENYGFRPDQFEFFSVHLVSDVAHAGAEMSAIAESCEDEAAVVAATEVACDRLLGFLDGCYASVGAG